MQFSSVAQLANPFVSQFNNVLQNQQTFRDNTRRSFLSDAQIPSYLTGFALTEQQNRNQLALNQATDPLDFGTEVNKSQQSFENSIDDLAIRPTLRGLEDTRAVTDNQIGVLDNLSRIDDFNEQIQEQTATNQYQEIFNRTSGSNFARAHQTLHSLEQSPDTDPRVLNIARRSALTQARDVLNRTNFPYLPQPSQEELQSAQQLMINMGVFGVNNQALGFTPSAVPYNPAG